MRDILTTVFKTASTIAYLIIFVIFVRLHLAICYLRPLYNDIMLVVLFRVVCLMCLWLAGAGALHVLADYDAPYLRWVRREVQPERPGALAR